MLIKLNVQFYYQRNTIIHVNDNLQSKNLINYNICIYFKVTRSAVL